MSESLCQPTASSSRSTKSQCKITEPEGRRNLKRILDFVSAHTNTEIGKSIQITVWNVKQNFPNSLMVHISVFFFFAVKFNFKLHKATSHVLASIDITEVIENIMVTIIQ